MIAILLVPILMATLTSGDNTTDITPVVANDGKDNFLILSDDEVKANPALLAYLSTANKADVEELVDSNPQFQEKIFDRIKAAVEARERQKQVAELVPAAPAMLIGANMEPTRAVPLGMPFETDTKAGGGDDDDDNDDDDDDRIIDKLKVAKIKAGVTKSALKIFKIGKNLKGKLKQYLKKGKDKTKQKRKKKAGSLTWPVFRYKVSTNNKDQNGKVA